MGITEFFSGALPFDIDVEKATSEKNTTEDWGKIMEVCDKVGTNSAKAKECLKSIMKRLQQQDPHIVLQAITLLDACVNNCGKPFQLEVSSRGSEIEIKLCLKKWLPNTAVGAKLRHLLKQWSEAEFKNDPQLNLMTSMWSRFPQEGIEMTIIQDPVMNTRSQRPVDPDVVASQQEVDDIAKAIELSLKESASPKTSSLLGSNSLYPTTASITSNASASTSVQAELYKVRALYDFEAAEDNELTFYAGEIIHVTDDSDANWWKGFNKRGEGLFPNNFVTVDLSTETEKSSQGEKKGVKFNESVEVKTVRQATKVEIDENKIDRLLNMLHEADPLADAVDSDEMIILEEEVTEMGPLIDAELEKIDRKHAQLSQLSHSLVEALNVYHGLMRDPSVHQKPMYHTLPHPGHFPPHQIPGPPPGPPPPHYMYHPNPTQFNPPIQHPPPQGVMPNYINQPPHYQQPPQNPHPSNQ